ncbi:hypothetical protein HPB48_000845 [Haemaphysalis longicornis]|uniref:PKD/REJ-like domain-containing protein n=1 Tax=Haemaphysalis longicornis TaxID=44386 RepID=A0A9J6FI51_HAELO|nr:hypothetical protein HPB48_000845 [Haemaphysalis longicornis]
MFVSPFRGTTIEAPAQEERRLGAASGVRARAHAAADAPGFPPTTVAPAASRLDRRIHPGRLGRRHQVMQSLNSCMLAECIEPWLRRRAWLNPVRLLRGRRHGLDRTQRPATRRGACGRPGAQGLQRNGKHSKVYASADREMLNQHRDCRGMCLAGQASSRGTAPSYARDACGVCVRAPVPKDASAHKDCLGVCRLPALSREKAVTLCGSCVGGNGTTSKADVMDGCGNCKTSKAPCPCEGAHRLQKKKKKKKRCRHLSLPATITLEGAFNGESRDILCVFRRRDGTTTEAPGEPPITAPGRGNGTVFACQPRAFSQVSFEKMEPGSAPYRREENKGEFLTLTFSGGGVPKFPLYCILRPTGNMKKRVVVPPQGAAPAHFTQCRVPLPKTSVEYVVHPSLDGQHPSGDGLQPVAVRHQAPDHSVAHHGGRINLHAEDDANLCIFLGEKLKLAFNSDNIVEDKQSVIWNVGEDLVGRSSYPAISTSTPFLTLEAEELEMDLQYLFTVKVTADSKNVVEASHALVRRDVNAPIVALFSDAMMDGHQELDYSWKVDTPLVRFNFDHRYSPAYRIRPFDLPADTNVTFTLRVSNYYAPEDYGEASVTLLVLSSPLTAVIKGGPTRIAGFSQNDVVLDGSPSSRGIQPLVYQWSCLDEDMQPCYDYGPAAVTDLLLNPLETNREVLRVMGERLEPGKRLNFTLEVFRGDNTSTDGVAASTLVVTRKETIPLVSLDEILVGNKPVYEYDSATDSYMVTAGPSVVIHAIFFVHSKSISINWNVPGREAKRFEI